MKTLVIAGIFLISQTHAVVANTTAVNSLMKSYNDQEAVVANTRRGEQMWNQKFTGNEPYTERSCNRCHTSTLTNTGKHAKTGKKIPAMAPSVNSKSLTSTKKIKKWLKRNCKWTLGRECTVQEKADLISFISQQ
jgi:cytochrome c5